MREKTNFTLFSPFKSVVQTSGDFAPWETANNVWRHFYLSQMGGEGVLLAPSRQGSGTLLHTPLLHFRLPPHRAIWPQCQLRSPAFKARPVKVGPGCT